MKPLFNLFTVLLIAVLLISCQKNLIEPIAVEDHSNPVTASSGRHTDTIIARINNILKHPKFGDTAAIVTQGGGIVGTGCSLLANWQFYGWNKAWNGLPFINRGISGSRWVDLQPYIYDLVTVCKPKVIVLYMGENEYFWSQSANPENKYIAKEIKPVFIKFFDELRRQNPKSHILIVSQQHCPALWYFAASPSWDIDSYNKVMRQKIYFDTLAGNRSSYIDISNHTQLWNPSRPYPELFASDGVHMHQKGYDVWTKILRPVVENLYKQYQDDF